MFSKQNSNAVMPYVYSVITVLTFTYNTTGVPRFEYAIDKEGT